MNKLPIAIDLPRHPRAIELFCRCISEVAAIGICPAWVPIDGLLTRGIVYSPQETAIYLALVKCLSRVNRWSLGEWRFPPLYDSGVYYEPEPPGVELFQSTAALYQRGKGDCDDLVAHRLAEVESGAEPFIYQVGESATGGRQLHLVIKRANGAFEDPSRALGMPAI